MSGLWCRVESGRIVRGPTTLRAAAYNVSARRLAELPAAELERRGVYPVPPPARDPRYQAAELLGVQYDAATGSIQAEWEVRAVDLEELRQQRIGDVLGERERRLEAGFDYQGARYRLGVFELATLTLAAATIAAGLGLAVVPRVWRSDGEVVELDTDAKVRAAGAAALEHVAGVDAAAAQHIAALRALATAQELAEYDVGTSWPR